MIFIFIFFKLFLKQWASIRFSSTLLLFQMQNTLLTFLVQWMPVIDKVGIFKCHLCESELKKQTMDVEGLIRMFSRHPIEEFRSTLPQLASDAPIINNPDFEMVLLKFKTAWNHCWQPTSKTQLKGSFNQSFLKMQSKLRTWHTRREHFIELQQIFGL